MAGKQCSGIINLLFDGFTDNTREHFTHCSHISSPLRGSENTTQLVKYPRVLSVKPSNKVYIFVFTCDISHFLTENQKKGSRFVSAPAVECFVC